MSHARVRQSLLRELNSGKYSMSFRDKGHATSVSDNEYLYYPIRQGAAESLQAGFKCGRISRAREGFAVPDKEGWPSGLRRLS